MYMISRLIVMDKFTIFVLLIAVTLTLSGELNIFVFLVFFKSTTSVH